MSQARGHNNNVHNKNINLSLMSMGRFPTATDLSVISEGSYRTSLDASTRCDDASTVASLSCPPTQQQLLQQQQLYTSSQKDNKQNDDILFRSFPEDEYEQTKVSKAPHGILGMLPTSLHNGEGSKEPTSHSSPLTTITLTHHLEQSSSNHLEQPAPPTRDATKDVDHGCCCSWLQAIPLWLRLAIVACLLLICSAGSVGIVASMQRSKHSNDNNDDNNDSVDKFWHFGPHMDPTPSPSPSLRN